MAIIDLLAEVPLFSGLQPADLELIGQRVRQRRYRAGEVIFHKDDPGVAFYMILSGRVKVHTEAPDGTDVTITFLSAGDFFGELSLLDGEPRSADVSTQEPTEVLVLNRDDLIECIFQAPQIAINLLATLAGRVRRTNETIQALSTLDVHGRVAKQLLLLARQHGVNTPQGVRIGIRLTQSDLAGLVGASRESVNKVLGYFRRRGYISLDDQHRITLLKPDELAKRSEG